jgi:hypothetical protein
MMKLHIVTHASSSWAKCGCYDPVKKEALPVFKKEVKKAEFKEELYCKNCLKTEEAAAVLKAAKKKKEAARSVTPVKTNTEKKHINGVTIDLTLRPVYKEATFTTNIEGGKYSLHFDGDTRRFSLTTIPTTIHFSLQNLSCVKALFTEACLFVEENFPK